MDQIRIKEIEGELWSAADALREGSSLTAAEYKDPILGLVFLRFLQNQFFKKDATGYATNSWKLRFLQL